MVKILMIIAQNNFRDEEFFEPKKIFDEERFEVDVASKEVGKCYSKFGIVVTANKSIDFIESIDEYDAVVFVGGLGSLEYEEDENAHRIIREVLERNKILASICISPRILIRAGVLKNKKFTMWNEDNSQDKYILESGGTFTGKDLEIDGNIITANGPNSAKDFGKAIVNKIKIK